MKPTLPFTREELLQIARSQETIINLILLNLLLGLCIFVSVMILGPTSTSGRIIILLVRGTILVINIMAVVFIFRLAKALHKTAWVYALAAFLPCIGLVTLLLVNHYATQTLRANGVRVGLLGARKGDLENIPPTAAPPPLS
jgi:multisubunit Na+/H+ antiporter MnhF subunit